MMDICLVIQVHSCQQDYCCCCNTVDCSHLQSDRGFVATEYSICHYLGSQQWRVSQESGVEGGVASGPGSPAGSSSLLLPGLLLQSKSSSSVISLLFKTQFVLTLCVDHSTSSGDLVLLQQQE